MRSKRKVRGGRTKRRPRKTKSRKHRSSKRKSRTVRFARSHSYYRGGEGTARNGFTPRPFKQYAFTCGTSPSSEALCTSKQQNIKQNNMQGGNASGRSRCGDIPSTSSTIPTFTGPAASGVTSANSVSQGSNASLLQGLASGCNDSFATAPVKPPPPPNGLTTKGGKRRKGRGSGKANPLGYAGTKKWRCYSGGKSRRVRYKK